MHDKKSFKRELILDTAFELILANGYSNTKIIDIAAKAGIGKGTVYEYFDSKESIVLELVNTRAKNEYMKIFDAVELLPTCREQLTKYLELHIATTAKYSLNVTDFRNEFLRSNSEISMKIIESIHSIIFIHFEFIHNLIKKGISTGELKNLNPSTAALCFLGSLNFYFGMIHACSECPELELFQRNNPFGDENSILDCMFNGFLA